MWFDCDERQVLSEECVFFRAVVVEKSEQEQGRGPCLVASLSLLHRAPLSGTRGIFFNFDSLERVLEASGVAGCGRGSGGVGRGGRELGEFLILFSSPTTSTSRKLASFFLSLFFFFFFFFFVVVVVGGGGGGERCREQETARDQRDQRDERTRTLVHEKKRTASNTTAARTQRRALRRFGKREEKKRE